MGVYCYKEPQQGHQSCCPHAEALGTMGIMWQCPSSHFLPRFHWAVFMVGYKDEMWGPTLQHQCGAPVNCFATGEHASDGTTRECVRPDFFFNSCSGTLRLRHAEVCVCAASTCGLTPTAVWEKSNWPPGGLCMSQFSFVFAPPSQFHHATWPYCAI